MGLFRGVRERYQSSLRLRLVVPILSALLVVIGFLSVMSQALLFDSLQVSTKHAATKTAALIARDPDVKADLISGLAEGIKERLLDTLASEDLVLAVGVYAADDDSGDQELIHAELKSEDLRRLIQDEISLVGRFADSSSRENSDGDGHSIITVTVAIQGDAPDSPLFGSLVEEGAVAPSRVQTHPSPALGSVRLAYSLQEAESMELRYRYLISSVALCLVLFSGLVADRLARRMLTPIFAVHRALQEATDGNLKIRLEETTKDELGEIANRFNICVQQLDANQEQIQNHTHTLEERVEERTEELSRAYRELQTLDKMKDNLLSNVSHEMRTPLTSIVASVEILSDFTEHDEAARQEFLEIIHKEAARLLRQICSVLDMAKMEAEMPVLRLAKVDLGEIAGTVIEGFAPLLEDKRIMLCCHEPDASLVLDCDAKHIIKVIDAVLANAITYSPEGGKIDIYFAAQSDSLELLVVDDGPGVPEEKRGLLFTVFGQISDGLTDKPKGLGIGLAISKRIAKAHGGDLRYVHKPSRGACFELSLPLSVPAEPAS